MNQNYTGLFENWEIGVAKKVIQEFKTQWKWLQRIDEEDLLQECLTHWIFSQNSFNAEAGAKRNTFMARVVANKLRDIVRKQSSDKRKVTHESSSIDQPLNDDEDSSSLLDVLASDSDFRFQADLKISIEQTFSSLTETQQKLCRYLSEGYTDMSDLAKTLGVGRATVYREIERIRSVFEKQGLKDFLK